MQQESLIEYEIEIGKFTFYSNMVIGQINKDVDVNKIDLKDVIQFTKMIYGNDVNIVYISNRIHEYSFNPTDFLDIEKEFPNLIGYAIVSKNKYQRMIGAVETLFINKPIAIFSNMDNAIDWAEKLINSKSQCK